jgi:hypothetical protein
VPASIPSSWSQRGRTWRRAGADLASPRLLDAYIAYDAGDTATALEQARQSFRDAPMLYEAGALVGKIRL